MRRLLVLPLAVALVRLCFDAVSMECGGNATDVIVRYSVDTAATLLIGWTEPGIDPDGNPIDAQPIYMSAPGPVIPDMAPGPARLCVDLVDDPPLGSVYYYTPNAIDIGGNSSSECL